MTSNNNKKFEDVFDEVLKLFEEGKSIPEIFDLFPEHKEDLKEIFETIELVRCGKDFIDPPQKVLSKIIERIPVKGVTYLKIRRYSYRGENKGRTSFMRNLINQIHKSMNLSWKLAFPIIFVVAIFTGLLIYSQSLKEVPQYSSAPSLRGELNKILPEFNKPKDVPVPVASGNIGNAINAILAFSINEEYAIDEEDIDAALINADDSMISDFGQSYGEDEF